ncbi:MAG: sulfatase, partial [Gammaproteobacteria bacterium]|nr:sulfatase [Gammaproteobacteria bacterium]
IASQMADSYQDWWSHTTGKGFKTTRSIIGTTHENPTRLTSHDWLAPTTAEVGHTPGFGSDQWAKRGWLGKEADYPISPWKVRAGEAGKYRFTLHFHDEPASKVIPNKFGHLSLNGKTHVAAIVEGATSVEFDVKLDKGDLDIKAWFDDSEDASDKPLAAFYIYVERLEP